MNLNDLGSFVVMIEKELNDAENNQKILTFEVSEENKIKMIITKEFGHKFFNVFAMNFNKLSVM